MTVTVHDFFDAATATFSYVVTDSRSNICTIIDAVKGFDYRGGRTSTEFADRLIACAKHNRYQVDWLLETHVHADHLSAASHIKECVGGRIGIGKNITQVQAVFKEIFLLEFATVRLRTAKTRNCVSRTTILMMVFKLGLSAEKGWRKLRGFRRLADAINNVTFIDGIDEKTVQQQKRAA